IPQIFWLFIVFVILYIFISRNAAPKISQVLKKRQDKIADDLSEAEALQAKAEQARATYEKSQEDARNNAATLVLNKREELKSAAEAEYKVLSDALTAKADEAQKNIDAAKDKAIGEVRGVATAVCADIVSKISGLSLDDDAVSSAVNKSTDAHTKGNN
ncbi:MAG: F0F1 ATP synthase subunit B', partial [Kordiimonadaceae bacterium]|nr:F0F1 ATP synthase subunit B' [Kordiimonadaceae bacterium]